MTNAITLNEIYMILGFSLSLYACVSNDVIQTLGTFLSTTREKPAWLIWLFASLVLVITFTLGWYIDDGDMAFGRLDRIPFAQQFYWWHVLPPVILIYLTKKGIPVATAFLILSIFSSGTVISLMLAKSFLGYVMAFTISIVLYFIISRPLEKKFLYTKGKKISKWWHVTKWSATAYLWSMWLMQDAANLYVYLPRKLDFAQMIVTLGIFVTFLGWIVYKRGGEIQNIVKLKTNTQDIRSATIIDVTYASILLYFQNVNNVPMSTTWVFLGLLAGREIAMYNRLRFETQKKVYKHVVKDFTKALIGLVVSMVVVCLINHFDKIIQIIHTYLHLD